LRVSVNLVFECAGTKEASALRRTLASDNKSLPKDQRMTVEQDGRELRFSIQSTRPVSVLSSVASLLSDAKLFQEVWNVAS